MFAFFSVFIISSVGICSGGAVGTRGLVPAGRTSVKVAYDYAVSHLLWCDRLYNLSMDIRYLLQLDVLFHYVFVL